MFSFRVQVNADLSRAAISDFGLAKLRASVRASGGMVGKANWMAPELADGKPHSFAADIYSLAMVRYDQQAQLTTRALPLSMCVVICFLRYDGM
jgi:serine/threonine protein kinase